MPIFFQLFPLEDRRWGKRGDKQSFCFLSLYPYKFIGVCFSNEIVFTHLDVCCHFFPFFFVVFLVVLGLLFCSVPIGFIAVCVISFTCFPIYLHCIWLFRWTKRYYDISRWLVEIKGTDLTNQTSDTVQWNQNTKTVHKKKRGDLNLSENYGI